MIGWLFLTDEQRRASLQEAFVRSGINAKALEKDWWVTLSLKALFTTEYAAFCTFKGGTSLSKGWKLVQRFSEDIDIALDPVVFGMEYRKEPSHSYVKKLKREGCQFTTQKITVALERAFEKLGLQKGTIIIEPEEVPADMPDKDPQTIYIRYNSLFDPHHYLDDSVKLEFGVRSLREPFAPVQIQSLLNEFFPNEQYSENAFPIMAVEARKTLLEKVFLLHEKLSLNYPAILKDDRQSRHLYDLVQLMDTPAGREALLDFELYNAIVEHRMHYVRLPGVEYKSLSPKNISFVPDEELLDEIQRDYETMQRSMIYGSSYDFRELINRLKILNGRIRLIGTSIQLETLIEAAMQKANVDANPDISQIMQILVEVPKGDGELCQFEVTLIQRRNKIDFEFIRFIE